MKQSNNDDFSEIKKLENILRKYYKDIVPEKYIHDVADKLYKVDYGYLIFRRDDELISFMCEKVKREHEDHIIDFDNYSCRRKRG